MKKLFVFGLLLIISTSVIAQKWEKGWTPENWERRPKNGDCSEFGKSKTVNFYDRDFFVTANFAYGIKPSTSFGLTFGMIGRFGWFVSVMSGAEFHSLNVDGSFYRDDQSAEKPFLLGDDNKSNTRLSAMVGGLVRLGKPVALRIGVGYGINELCYKSPDNKWFLDKKYSVRGLDASVGLQFHIKKLVVSADAVATNFDMLECKVGAGIIF